MPSGGKQGKDKWPQDKNTYGGKVKSGKKINMEDVVAVILAGGRDFGRCPLTTAMAAWAWSVEGKSVLARLIDSLLHANVKKVLVCSNSDMPCAIKSLDLRDHSGIEFIDEPLPVGTAGCLRLAASRCTARYYALYSASMVTPPDIKWITNAHVAAKSNLTVFLQPAETGVAVNRTAGIYMADVQAAKCIPSAGYCDIKEGLIPILWRKGLSSRALSLHHDSGSYRNIDQYLHAIGGYLKNSENHTGFIHAQAQVSPSARINGPVSIQAGARIEAGSVILGPAIIESGSVVGPSAVVRSSVLWSGSKVGQGACVSNSVLANDAVVSQKAFIQNKACLATTLNPADRLTQAAYLAKSRLNELYSLFEGAFEKQASKFIPSWMTAKTGSAIASVLWLMGIFLALLWLYWPEITDLRTIWAKSDEYSSGLLVPFLAGYIIWSRWPKLRSVAVNPCIWGLALLAIAQLLRLFGLTFMYASAQRLSLILSVAGLIWYLFGTQFFKKIIPVVLFLILMLPMPKSVHSRIMLPLQHWATVSSVFSLETLGFEVWREGNMIHVNNVTVAVAEACNGLRMLTAFFIISTLVVLLVERTWWEKLIILFSAVPIGFFCNTIRLTLTAMAFTVIQGQFWEKLFHDFGGIAMMPLALAVIVLELWLLRRIFVLPAANPGPIHNNIIVKKAALNAVTQGEIVK